jgi:peroxiredoxin
MKKLLNIKNGEMRMKLLILSALITLSQWSFAAPKASDFNLVNQKGEKVTLKQYAGKTVVLEWFNHGCPFVRKHYDSNNMQALQKKYTAKGIVWLSIVSSAAGKQGFLADPAKANKKYQEEKMQATHLLLDPSGEVGKKYQAKTTPHMFIVNNQGELIYEGAIDSIRSTDADDIPQSTNYVDQVLSKVVSGKAVAYSKTQAYGCSVKY